MRIAVIGAGNVGSSLGRVWAQRGHEVHYVVRDPEKYASDATLVDHAEVVGLDAIPVDADVVVVATPAAAVETLCVDLHDYLEGRAVIDVTNPLGRLPHDVSSVTELIARRAPGAKPVKAFNVVGAHNYAALDFPGGRAVTLLAGDDPDAKGIAFDLADSLGFEAHDLGGIDQAHLAEAFALCWITLARKGLGRDWAFGVLRRDA